MNRDEGSIPFARSNSHKHFFAFAHFSDFAKTSGVLSLFPGGVAPNAGLPQALQVSERQGRRRGLGSS